MSPKFALDYIVRPACKALGQKFDSPEAHGLMLAIALQESGLSARAQKGGPARSLWQFEKGGVAGVLNHYVSTQYAQAWTGALLVHADPDSVYVAVEYCDLLAAIFARLLLYTDAQPLPPLTDEAATWAYYQRNWRPGAPRPHDWPANLTVARNAVEP